MGLNRMLMCSQGENALIMTMGYKKQSKTSLLYGYSAPDAIGGIEGTLLYKGNKAIITYFSITKQVVTGIPDRFFFTLRFTADVIDTSSINATVTLTEIETGKRATLTIGGLYYDYDLACYMHSILNINNTPFANFAVDTNVGKQFKVEIIFD